MTLVLYSCHRNKLMYYTHNMPTVHKTTSFKMNCNAQWSVVGLRWRHLKRPLGTRVRLRFLSNRLWLNPKDFCKWFVTICSPLFLKSWRLSFTEIHGEKVGLGKLFRSADAYKHCLNIIILVKKRLIYNSKTPFSCQRIVSGNKANVAHVLCHTKLVTPVSNRGRFLSLKYSFSKFVFHEIRLNDKML